MSFWYVASPYSRYPLGIVHAHAEICRQTALLVKAGIPAFSPIAMTHPIAIEGDIDPFDHNIWLEADRTFMEAAKGLIVCKMQGWEESYGIGVEIESFERQGKPVYWMEPGELPDLSEDSVEPTHEAPAQSLIAFAGVARAGKDEAAQALIAAGYERCCFGDIIKEQLDVLCCQHLGVSAFTEDDEQKQRIRPVLEAWGDVNADGIADEFFANLPSLAVNTRLVRVREAKEWRNRGGLVVEIKRIGYGPASNWERDCLNELRQAGCIDATITNDGTIADLHAKVRDFANGMGACRELSEAARC
jgi:hypothetical protein